MIFMYTIFVHANGYTAYLLLRITGINAFFLFIELRVTMTSAIALFIAFLRLQFILDNA